MATSTLQTTTTVRTVSPCVVPENQISDEILLTDIFKAYYDARKNKRNSPSQVRFERNLSMNLISLYEDIRNGKYKVGRSMCFIIDGHVRREVFAAPFRDRIVHHLIYNHLNPILDSIFIDDCYSCRIGRGTHFGMKRMQMHMNSCIRENDGEAYVLKLDIKSYFMTINRDKLFALISDALRGYILPPFLKNLIAEVVFSNPTKGCRIKGKRSDWNLIPKSKSLFFAPKGCGLPIGNLTSQLFSNIYLSVLDRFVTEELGIKHYGRYVDDFYLIHNSKQTLLESIPKIRKFLKDTLFLELHQNKVYLQSCKKGAQFLGGFVTPSKILVNRDTRQRVKRKIDEVLTFSPDPFYNASVLNSTSIFMTKHLNPLE